MLAEHPEITNRLREEVLNHIGPERRPTYEDLRGMKYLRAFVNETLRLFPAVYVFFAIFFAPFECLTRNTGL